MSKRKGKDDAEDQTYIEGTQDQTKIDSIHRKAQERNRVLSETRASTTQAYLRSITKKSFTFSSSSQSKAFSNATPQGRFLNRNIKIRVTTP